MKKVTRSEIVDYQTYDDTRAQFREYVFAEKAKRRIHVGEYLTFLFETTDTIRYQIQEIMRVERVVREQDIQHEIATYNALLGAVGELGCTLLVEIEDPSSRDECLRRWADLPAHVYVKLADGRAVRARWDEAQISETRLSSVQYLKFKVGEGRPMAVGVDHPELTAETLLSEEQQQTLYGDLCGIPG